jgi:two-component system, chemotaxis family, protein-glutamate methylesterase/glutaminase
MNNTIKVLIADDSALMRRTITDILKTQDDIEVIGIARNGEDVLNKAKDLLPDVITMDINMPVLDGISALKWIVKEGICPVIIISSLTGEGDFATLQALEIGAFDCIEKPDGESPRRFKEIKKDLIDKIQAAAKFKRRQQGNSKIILPKKSLLENRDNYKYSESELKAVAIGLSTGGPRTIQQVVPLLPPDLNAVYFIVQHMPAHFTAPFASGLNQASKLKVVESQPGVEIERGTVYVAKGGYQFNLFQKSNGSIIIRLTTKPFIRFMPSVDVMMDSVLEVFGKNTIGVLMTGMGSDGANAMVHIKEKGGYTIAESEETSVVFGMPKEAINRGGATVVLPNYEIADEIVKAISL